MFEKLGLSTDTATESSQLATATESSQRLAVPTTNVASACGSFSLMGGVVNIEVRIGI
jgi:hypothetical protein